MSRLFVPYRICPLGAHIDHQLGMVTGIAINKGIHLHYDCHLVPMMASPTLEPQMCVIDINNLSRTNDWSDYLKGSIYILSKYYDLNIYIKGEIQGDFPIGGLSSSAATVIAYILALTKVNNIKITAKQLIQYAYEVEHDYLQINIGKLDQSTIVYAEENKLLTYDFKSNRHKNIDLPQPFNFMIIHSGLERCLINSDYNKRVNECKELIDKINKNGFSENQALYLREIKKSDFNKAKDVIDPVLIKRGLHYYSEMDRVREGRKQLQSQDFNIQQFGNLITQSGASSIYNYETGCEQLIYLYNLLKINPFIYGTRFNGAGFKGSCMALVKEEVTTDSALQEQLKCDIINTYKEKYPNLDIQIEFVETTDGIKKREGLK